MTVPVCASGSAVIGTASREQPQTHLGEKPNQPASPPHPQPERETMETMPGPLEQPSCAWAELTRAVSIREIISLQRSPLMLHSKGSKRGAGRGVAGNGGNQEESLEIQGEEWILEKGGVGSSAERSGQEWRRTWGHSWGVHLSQGISRWEQPPST